MTSRADVISVMREAAMLLRNEPAVPSVAYALDDAILSITDLLDAANRIRLGYDAAFGEPVVSGLADLHAAIDVVEGIGP